MGKRNQPPSAPWSWRYFGVLVGNLTANLLQSGQLFAQQVTEAMAEAHNYAVDRKTFHEEAALELETLYEPTEE